MPDSATARAATDNWQQQWQHRRQLVGLEVGACFLPDHPIYIHFSFDGSFGRQTAPRCGRSEVRTLSGQSPTNPEPSKLFVVIFALKQKLRWGQKQTGQHSSKCNEPTSHFENLEKASALKKTKILAILYKTA